MKRELTHGSPFGGAEGFGSGAAPAGIKTEWSCEFEKYRTEVIKKNSGGGHTVYGDIRTLENLPFVNVISGGFPLARTSALPEKAQELRAAGPDCGDGCTVMQTAADSIQRNFKLRQSEYGLSLKDSLLLK
jgi:site-specific DNA-cytosine methylase